MFLRQKNIHHISTLDSEGVKKPLSSWRLNSGDTSEPLPLPEWEQDSRPKTLKGECVSNSSERGSGEQKIQSPEPGCFSESTGILPLPARDLSVMFPPAALKKTNPALCGECSSVRAPVERGQALQ
ncbi:hypothetical protein GOODEAATRI_012934 [Goodea atripinnis]|uniref:Prolactin receptor n=1 Tax=Goodea atripinnis TaxID=208336 RepID=A0ABV0NWT0_9TELE